MLVPHERVELARYLRSSRHLPRSRRTELLDLGFKSKRRQKRNHRRIRSSQTEPVFGVFGASSSPVSFEEDMGSEWLELSELPAANEGTAPRPRKPSPVPSEYGSDSCISDDTLASGPRSPLLDVYRFIEPVSPLSPGEYDIALSGKVSVGSVSLPVAKSSGRIEISWGPEHPCFPHLNPHVPVSSPEYANTRVIRIRREWLIAGDIAPTFSNVYPEILEPYLSEEAFHDIIGRINGELLAAFSSESYSVATVIDSAIDLLTRWLGEDVTHTRLRRRLAPLDDWLQEWNASIGARRGVKTHSLKSTGYMSVDIEIPNPNLIVPYESRASLGDEVETSFPFFP